MWFFPKLRHGLVPPHPLFCTNTAKRRASQPFKTSSGLFARFGISVKNITTAKTVTWDTYQYGLCEMKYRQLQVFITSLTTSAAQPVWAPLILSLHAVVLSAYSTAAGHSKKTHFIFN